MSGGPPPHQQAISGISASYGSIALAGNYPALTNVAISTRERPSQPRPKPFPTIPFRQDEDFVNRGDILDQIEQICSKPAGRAALVGLGGVGKSQLAIEYAHRLRKRSPDTWVFWVHASNIARVEAAYTEIANKIALPERNEATSNVLKQVVNWLSDENNGSWLMIVDNADTLATVVTQGTGAEKLGLADLVPESNNGAVLITSRHADVAREMAVREQDIIRVGAMAQHEAVQLLEKKLASAQQDRRADLVTALELIPLAITQAAAYIHRQPRMTISAYLDKLSQKESRLQILMNAATDARRDKRDQGASNSIIKTWELSFDQIRAERPSAAELLSFMSFFNRQGIPHSMLRGYTEKARPVTKHGAASSDEATTDSIDEDIAILHSFSLATHTDDGYTMHGLVQLATRAWLRMYGSEDQWWEKYVSAIAATFPKGEFQHWATCRRLLPHIQSIRERQPSAATVREWVKVLANSGHYQMSQGLYSQAEQLVQQSLGECEARLGDEDSATLRALSILGAIMRHQGNYEEAEEVSRRLLEGSKKKHGASDPVTLTAANNLALVLQNLGKYSEAEEMNRQVLKGFEEVFGKNDQYTLASVGNLALSLQSQGKYDKAEEMSRRVLIGREKALGRTHPDTLVSVNNLASVLQDQEKYSEAGEMHLRVLQDREKELGGYHPYTLGSVHSLAVCLLKQKKYSDAEARNQQALTGQEEMLGAEHVDTLLSVGLRAGLLRSRGEYEEAEKLNRRALAGLKEKLGADHLITLTNMRNLAFLTKQMGKDSEAVSLMEECLETSIKAHGLNHPDTVQSATALSEWQTEREAKGSDRF